MGKICRRHKGGMGNNKESKPTSHRVLGVCNNASGCAGKTPASSSKTGAPAQRQECDTAVLSSLGIVSDGAHTSPRNCDTAVISKASPIDYADKNI